MNGDERVGSKFVLIFIQNVVGGGNTFYFCIVLYKCQGGTDRRGEGTIVQK